MELPKSKAFQSAIYNKEINQLELVNENISPSTPFVIIDNSELSQEELETISLHIVDSKNKTFNIGSLNQLIIYANKESDKLVTPLQNGIEAVAPLTFIFKSETINLEEHNFKISW